MQLEISIEPPSPDSCMPPDVFDISKPIDITGPVYIFMSVKDSGPGLKSVGSVL